MIMSMQLCRRLGGNVGASSKRYIMIILAVSVLTLAFVMVEYHGVRADDSDSKRNVQQSYLPLLRYEEAPTYPKPKGNNDTDTNSTKKLSIGDANWTYTSTTNKPNHPFQDWRSSSALLHPGRFKQAEYNNLTVQVAYNANENAQPHTRYDCAPGLVCNFSDKSWHETWWNDRFVSYPSSKQGVKNKVQVSLECPVLSMAPHDREDDLAGIATTDFRSDIPTEYISMFGRISDYYARPKSEGTTKWKILYIQSNCNLVHSGRELVIRKLMERGLVDSYGKCNNNAVFPKGLGSGQGQKEKMIQMYAFTAAFENSIYPGYATEKIWQPLWFGSVQFIWGVPTLGASSQKTLQSLLMTLSLLMI